MGTAGRTRYCGKKSRGAALFRKNSAISCKTRGTSTANRQKLHDAMTFFLVFYAFSDFISSTERPVYLLTVSMGNPVRKH
jgi:hypothetical protein